MLRQKFRVRELDPSVLIASYRSADSRLVLLDFDGTLVPFQSHPKMPIETEKVKSIISSLANDPKNLVIVVSGRDKSYLDLAFDDINFGMAAEHGAFYKDPFAGWKSMFVQPGEWIQKTLPALNSLAFHYEGSVVEEKAYSIAWHYRSLRNKLSSGDIRQILAAIRSLPEYDQFIVSQSEFTIELRTPGVDKGAFLARWVENQRFDFVLAMGDSETDEDMFKIFDESCYTVKIGRSDHSAANYFIKDQMSVLPLINSLARINYKKVNDSFQKDR
jgi:trehalose 6-phosphate synthase/phosphatase